MRPAYVGVYNLWVNDINIGIWVTGIVPGVKTAYIRIVISGIKYRAAITVAGTMIVSIVRIRIVVTAVVIIVPCIVPIIIIVY